jgi:hypothetical protein
MLTLITGVPGSGKSLYATKLILDICKENDEYKKKGEHNKVRPIYVDIDGFDHEKAGTHPMPESGDWRDTPDGSICVYDECQQRFGPDRNGRSDNPIIADLEIHRHSGHDIFFITQRERLLHSHIRDLIGKHYHIQRVMGSHNVKVYSRDETIDTKSTSCLNNYCDQKMWRYDKKLFDYYKSATVHTHKFKLPSWMKASLFFIALAVLVTGGAFYSAIGFFTGDNIAELTGAETSMKSSFNFVESGNKSPAFVSSGILSNIDSIGLSEHANPADVAALSQIVRPPEPSILELSGCYSYGDNCKCITKNGQAADYITFNMCKRYINRSTNVFYKSNGKDEKDNERKPLTQTRI